MATKKFTASDELQTVEVNRATTVLAASIEIKTCIVWGAPRDDSVTDAAFYLLPNHFACSAWIISDEYSSPHL